MAVVRAEQDAIAGLQAAALAPGLRPGRGGGLEGPPSPLRRGLRAGPPGPRALPGGLDARRGGARLRAARGDLAGLLGPGRPAPRRGGRPRDPGRGDPRRRPRPPAGRASPRRPGAPSRDPEHGARRDGGPGGAGHPRRPRPARLQLAAARPRRAGPHRALRGGAARLARGALPAGRPLPARHGAPPGDDLHGRPRAAAGRDRGRAGRDVPPGAPRIGDRAAQVGLRGQRLPRPQDAARPDPHVRGDARDGSRARRAPPPRVLRRAHPRERAAQPPDRQRARLLPDREWPPALRHQRGRRWSRSSTR